MNFPHLFCLVFVHEKKPSSEALLFFQSHCRPPNFHIPFVPKNFSTHLK